MNKGRYNGLQIISEDYVNFMTSAHPHSGGYYGGHIWLNPNHKNNEKKCDEDLLSENHPIHKRSWIKDVAPSDMFYMSGHDGQNVFIIPSKKLVITRLGYTHDSELYTQSFLTSLLTCMER
jgi:CubicO group peptidase (beta-lactamase class C family)